MMNPEKCAENAEPIEFINVDAVWEEVIEASDSIPDVLVYNDNEAHNG